MPQTANRLARIRHERLAEALRHSENGEMPGHLPSTVALSAERATVAKAPAILERDGMITPAEGRRGYDVAARPKRRHAHSAAPVSGRRPTPGEK